jgi:hypothetical protein
MKSRFTFLKVQIIPLVEGAFVNAKFPERPVDADFTTGKHLNDFQFFFR